MLSHTKRLRLPPGLLDRVNSHDQYGYHRSCQNDTPYTPNEVQQAINSYPTHEYNKLSTTEQHTAVARYLFYARRSSTNASSIASSSTAAVSSAGRKNTIPKNCNTKSSNHMHQQIISTIDSTYTNTITVDGGFGMGITSVKSVHRRSTPRTNSLPQTASTLQTTKKDTSLGSRKRDGLLCNSTVTDTHGINSTSLPIRRRRRHYSGGSSISRTSPVPMAAGAMGKAITGGSGRKKKKACASSNNNRSSAVGLGGKDENTKNGSKSPVKPAAAGTVAPLSPRKLSPPQFSIPKPTSKRKLSSSLLDFDSVGLRNTPKEKSNDDISGVDNNGSNKKRGVYHTNHTLAGRQKESRYEKYTSTTNNNNITVITSISCVSNESPTSSHPKQWSLESKNRLLYQIPVKDIPSLSQLPTEWQDKDLTHRSDLGNLAKGVSDWHAYPGKTDDEKRRNRGLDDSEVNGPRNTGAWNKGPFRQIPGTKDFECCKDSGGCGLKLLVTEVQNISTILRDHTGRCPARIESRFLTLGLPLVLNETTGELESVCWCLKNLATLEDEGIVHAKFSFAKHEAKCKKQVEGIVPMLAHYTEVFPKHKQVSQCAENTEMDWTKKDSKSLYDYLTRNITQTNVIADVKCFGFNDGGATLPILLSREENEVAEETLQAVIDSAGEDDGVVDAVAVEAAKKKGFSQPFIEYEVKEAGLSMP